MLHLEEMFAILLGDILRARAFTDLPHGLLFTSGGARLGCTAGDPALFDACIRLLPGVLEAARSVPAESTDISEDTLPRHVAGSLMHVLAEAASTYDGSLSGRDQLQGTAALLTALRPSLGSNAANKARYRALPVTRGSQRTAESCSQPIAWCFCQCSRNFHAS